jgi:chromosome segregation ATPase
MADCRSIQLDAATAHSPSTASKSRQSCHHLVLWLGAIDVDRGRNTNSYSTIDLSSFLNYMSEERLERIENQLSQVIQAVGVMQQNMSVMQQNMMAMQNRMDSMEGTLLTTMTDGFNSLQNYIIDLDTDLAQNERKTEDNARNNRRLNQRLMRLENRNDDF